MLFAESRPDRQRRDPEANARRIATIQASPVPPAKSFELLQPHDLQQDRVLAFDAELFPNYTLFGFKCFETRKAIFFEDSPDSWIDTQLLSYVLHRFLTVGFNSIKFDNPLVTLALQQRRAPELFRIAQRIIAEGMTPYQVKKDYQFKELTINNIDLFDVAPLDASLKIYAGRLHCERMQDLPFKFDTVLTKEQAAIVRDYNINDLDNTILLCNGLKPQLELREELGRRYNQDLRSKSDAQIAEAIIGSELDKLHSFGWERSATKRIPIEPGWQFKYKLPNNLSFKTPILKNALDVIASATFVVGNGGYADPPPEIEALEFELGATLYQMGGGGLHSTEKAVCHVASPSTLILDRDVASYYPAIILNQELFPCHLGKDFLTVYRGIVNRRLLAKLEKRKSEADGLKITVNGSFGKFGNMFSRLYAPDLLMQVTLSGQLYLLMLIEMLELAGLNVISGNTDGIITKCHKYQYTDFENIVLTWEAITGFKTEETRYEAIYNRDVNNYIAVKTKYTVDEKSKDIIWHDGVKDGCKTKGIYSERGSALDSVLSKNPECLIITDALQSFFAHNKPIVETITQCTDIRRFVSVRTCKGQGAEKDGVYLGKAIRWYYAKGEKGFIVRVASGHKVPKTDGARPLMILPHALPADLDHAYYINEAHEALYDLGYLKRPGLARLL